MVQMTIYRFDSMAVAPLQRLLSSAQLAWPPHLRSVTFTSIINWLGLNLMKRTFPTSSLTHLQINRIEFSKCSLCDFSLLRDLRMKKSYQRGI